MGNKNSKKNKNFPKEGYKIIDYPLNGIDNKIEYDIKNCDNYRKANHDNIEIIYEKESNDIPTIYRCPVCLSIPFLYYNKSNIIYRCNCGSYSCSIDYFLTNFNSYTISKIKYKNNSEINNEIAFCSTCSKFIEPSNHKNEYYGHVIRILDDIYFKSESGNNYDGFNYMHYPFFDGINISSQSNEKNISSYNKTIHFNNLISKYFNFDINKLIEKRYNDFNKIFDEKNKSKDFKEVKDLNSKLYLFSKYLYYVFAKNYAKNNLDFQILINLAFNLKQLYDPDLYNNKKKKKKDKNKIIKNFDIYKNYFLEDFDDIIIDEKLKLIKDLKYGLNHYKISTSNYFNNILYDIYSKRNIVICRISFFITEKNDISKFYIKSEYANFANLIYFSFLQKNILVFQEKHDLYFCDLEDAKILNKITLDKDIIHSYNDVKNIELLEYEYLILNLEDKFLIYRIFPGENNSLFQNEYLNNIPHNYININRYKDMIVFQAEKKLIFSKLNKNENNFQEVFFLSYNSVYTIEIIDINNNQILIKYLRGYGGGNQYLNKFEIYNIENKQKLSEVECDKPFNDIFFFGEKYLLQISDHYFYILELNSLNRIAEGNKQYYGDLKDWAIFKDHNEEWNIICNHNCYKLKDEKIELIKKLDYNNIEFHSSMKYANKTYYY